MKSLNPLPKLKDLKKRFSCNTKTGEFTYLVSAGGVKAGTKTKGSLTSSGYYTIKYQGQPIRAHQLVYLFEHNEPANCILDHINGDRGDNRAKNLRKSNPSLNGHNRSDVKGYYFNKDMQKWRALIRIDGVVKHLGYYETETEAAAAYRGAKKLLGLDK